MIRDEVQDYIELKGSSLKAPLEEAPNACVLATAPDPQAYFIEHYTRVGAAMRAAAATVEAAGGPSAPVPRLDDTSCRAAAVEARGRWAGRLHACRVHHSARSGLFASGFAGLAAEHCNVFNCGFAGAEAAAHAGLRMRHMGCGWRNAMCDVCRQCPGGILASFRANVSDPPLNCQRLPDLGGNRSACSFWQVVKASAWA